jgi:hypothetical protein
MGGGAVLCSSRDPTFWDAFKRCDGSLLMVYRRQSRAGAGRGESGGQQGRRSSDDHRSSVLLGAVYLDGELVVKQPAPANDEFTYRARYASQSLC